MNSSKDRPMTVEDLLATVNEQDDYIYIAFAVVILVANFVVAMVLLSNKDLLKKSAFIAGLCFADMLNGIALVVTGSLRLYYIQTSSLALFVHPFDCWMKMTILWTAATELLATMMLLIGTERALATLFFKWYWDTWSNKLTWKLTLTVYGISISALLALSFKMYYNPFYLAVPQHCFTPLVVGPVYSSYEYLLVTLCGTMAIVSTVTSLAIIRRRRRKFKTGVYSNDNNLQSFLTRQWNTSITLTIVAIFDFTLVVIPNTLKIVAGFNPLNQSLLSLGMQMSYMFFTRSAISPLIYILTNKDFRLRFFQMMRLNKAASAVTPTG